jgi:hypothetical protein
LEDLRANRVQTLHLDRRALWGRTKSLTRAAEDNPDNWDNNTNNNNNNNTNDENEEEDQGQWWQEFFALLPSAGKLQHVVVHDEVLPLLLPLPDLPASGNNSSSSNPLTRLLQVLPSLPQLRQLRLYVSRPATLEWSVLQDVVPACRRLEQLVLCHGTWWNPSFSTASTTSTSNNTAAPGLVLSSASDVTCLAKALAHHPCLTEVSLQDLVVRVPWHALLTALATLPRLQVVNLTLQGSGGGQQAPPRVSNRSLAAFLSVPTLQDVTLWSMGLDNAHMRALQQALPGHASLVFLSLRGNPGLTRAGGVQLCRAVEANTSLRSVYTDAWDDNDETTSNEETVCLDEWLGYILYWNQCGRGALLQSNAADTWHKALAQHAADLPTLYYLLRQGHAHVLPSSS